MNPYRTVKSELSDVVDNGHSKNAYAYFDNYLEFLHQFFLLLREIVAYYSKQSQGALESGVIPGVPAIFGQRMEIY